jgi:hypothetical protein
MYAVLLRYASYSSHSYPPVLVYELQRKLPRSIASHVQSHRSVRRFFGEMFGVRGASPLSEENKPDYNTA